MLLQLDHLHFPAPNIDVVIWRYSSLSKLMSLLISKSIYLTSLSQLRANDPLEGHVTNANILLCQKLETDYDFAKKFMKEVIPDNVGDKQEHLRLIIEQHKNPFKMAQHEGYINCWHINKYESAALWSIYSRHEDGVAIKSTVGRAKDALAGDELLIGGYVTYHDYDRSLTLGDNVFRAAFNKRSAFEYEKEFRIFGWRSNALTPAPPGIAVPCEPSTLMMKYSSVPMRQTGLLTPFNRLCPS